MGDEFMWIKVALFPHHLQLHFLDRIRDVWVVLQDMYIEVALTDEKHQ